MRISDWSSDVCSSDLKMLIVARTVPVAEAPKRTHGISLFMVDVNRQRLSHTAIDKVGTNTLPSSPVNFYDLRFEPEELTGTEHEGWGQLLAVKIGRDSCRERVCQSASMQVVAD